MPEEPGAWNELGTQPRCIAFQSSQELLHDRTTFEITKTVRDEDVPAARAEIEAILEEVKDLIPEAEVSEITVEPAVEERVRPFQASMLRVN